MIMIEVSLGELVDRISILEIKSALIQDESKLKNVKRELANLSQTLDLYCSEYDIDIPEMLKQKISSINLTLWNIEDDLRKKEAKLEFDAEFIEKARGVYHTNDLRFVTKTEISMLDPNFGVREEKHYDI